MKPAIAPFLTLVTLLLSLHFFQGEAVTCEQVDAALIPCITYLTGRDEEPSRPCCDGVKAVKGMAQTTPDKRVACSCVKAAATSYADLKDDAAQSLPTKCGVELDIPVSRDVNCNKIN